MKDSPRFWTHKPNIRTKYFKMIIVKKANLQVPSIKIKTIMMNKSKATINHNNKLMRIKTMSEGVDRKIISFKNEH